MAVANPVRYAEMLDSVGRLFGDEVAGVGDDHALHVVRDQLPPLADLLTEARRQRRSPARQPRPAREGGAAAIT
jgi:hypothetical protein